MTEHAVIGAHYVLRGTESSADDNPFRDTSFYKIEDIKGKWVKYRHYFTENCPTIPHDSNTKFQFWVSFRKIQS